MSGDVVGKVLHCVILSYKRFWEMQLSFHMWTDQMQESLNFKKKGDVAFRQKDFREAIECYTQVCFFSNRNTDICRIIT